MKKIKFLPAIILTILISVGYASTDQWLKFTHSGDDGTSGICTGYVVKRANTADSLVNNWNYCQIVGDTVWNTQNKVAGTPDSVLVPFSSYQDGKYYFSMRAFDEKYNVSGAGNTPTYEIDNTSPGVVTCGW